MSDQYTNAAFIVQELGNIVRAGGMPVQHTQGMYVINWCTRMLLCDLVNACVHNADEDRERAVGVWQGLSADLKCAAICMDLFRNYGQRRTDWDTCARCLLTAPEVARWLEEREPTPHAERPAETLAEDAWRAQRMAELGWGTVQV
jgi:hypothetical protein